MPRQSVADLLSEADEVVPVPVVPAVLPSRPAPTAAAEGAPAPAPPKAPARTRRAPAPRAGRAAREAGTAGVTESQAPKWKGLERKELRLRADQLDELARLRRTLNRQRAGGGERITENTLIRVAVDMLLSRADRLRGTTEDELRKSVTP
jgi:hypothetical protein